MKMTPAIQIKNLTKNFGKITVLNNINISINSKEIFGITGENGAGKTTLLKILATLILPNFGEVYINDINIIKNPDKIKPLIGLVNNELFGFYPRLTGMQNLQFFGSLYDLHSSKINERLKYLINSFELFPYININFQKLPTGIKQRLAIVRALLHNPSILLLDEPTRSLDFKFVDTFYKFLKEELVEKEGKTIVLVSHNKSEIEKLATNSIVLNNGIIK